MTRTPRLMAGLAFVATFAAGAASMRAVDRWSRRGTTASQSASWPDVAAKLRLSPAQREQVDSVFARYQPATDSVLASLAPRLRAVSDSMHREIETLLTAEQRAQLRELRRPATFVLRRKSPAGTRVDTVRVPPGF